MKLSVLAFRLLPALFCMGFAENAYCLAHGGDGPRMSEVSAGYGMIICQSTYGFDNFFGAEVLYGRSVRPPVAVQAGLRMSLNPSLPEGFVRLLLSHRFGWWLPTVGIETGMTKRMHFTGNNTEKLREARASMTKDMGYSYLSSHMELLSFIFHNRWRVSLMGIDAGTHCKHFGRTLRMQVNFLTAGAAF